MLSKQKIKYIQSLGQKKFREEEAVFIAEGPKLVAELLADKLTRVREVFATGEWFFENGLIPGEKSFHLITDIDLERISKLTTPNKVLAIAEQYEESDHIEAKDRISLVLDSIQDPGNFGTIIRIADWFGLDQIIASKDSADRYNPKVVQATMGSIARIKVYYRDLPEWLISIKGVPVYATSLQGKDIHGIKKIVEGIIVVGNESKGISAEIIALADQQVAILRKGKAESLNAAVAAGIILSHIVD